MARYHINSNGEAGGCPFGGENEHYSTPEDARKAYEKVMSGETWTGVRPTVREAKGSSWPMITQFTDEDGNTHTHLDLRGRTFHVLERQDGEVYAEDITL